MSLYLLDTNIVSDLVRNPQGSVAGRIRQAGEDAVATSIIVAAELRFGAAKSGSAKLLARIEAILSALEIIQLAPPADQHYARIRKSLEARGLPIGANDLFIAAHACALGRVLVSANVKEFARVPALKIENWNIPAPQKKTGKT